MNEFKLIRKKNGKCPVMKIYILTNLFKIYKKKRQSSTLNKKRERASESERDVAFDRFSYYFNFDIFIFLSPENFLSLPLRLLNIFFFVSNNIFQREIIIIIIGRVEFLIFFLHISWNQKIYF